MQYHKFPRRLHSIPHLTVRSIECAEKMFRIDSRRHGTSILYCMYLGQLRKDLNGLPFTPHMQSGLVSRLTYE